MVASVGNRGTALSSGNNQTSLALPVNGNVAASRSLVVLVAVDNIVTSNAEITTANGQTSGVTDAAGNTYSLAKGWNIGGGGAQSGAEITIWVCNLATQLNSGQNITATFRTSASADASAMTAWEFQPTASTALQVSGTGNGSVTASGSPSLTATTTDEIHLRVRATAAEHNVATNWTPTASWTAFTAACSGAGTTATEMAVRGEWIIVTGTSVASAPTLAGTYDAAHAYAAFKEVFVPHNLGAGQNLVAPAPVLGTPDLVQVVNVHDLAASGFTSPAPSLQTAALTQDHIIGASGYASPAPVLGTPIFAQNVTLPPPSNYTAPLPVFSTPSTFTQKHLLLDLDLLTPAPTFTTPTLLLVSDLKLGDHVLDNGLAVLDTEADRIYICNNFPSTYTEATSTFALGQKNFGVGLVFAAPSAGVPKGRVVTSNPVSGGTVSVAGAPQCWAVVDSVNSRLLAIGPASGFTVVSPSWTWTLGQIPIHMDG